MRDYNHWAVLGMLCELLPLPDNRVTLPTSPMDTACVSPSPSWRWPRDSLSASADEDAETRRYEGP